MTLSNGFSNGLSIRVNRARIMELAYLPKVEWLWKVVEGISKREAFDKVDKVLNPWVLELFWDKIRECHIVSLNNNGRIRSTRAFENISFKIKYIKNLRRVKNLRKMKIERAFPREKNNYLNESWKLLNREFSQFIHKFTSHLHNHHWRKQRCKNIVFQDIVTYFSCHLKFIFKIKELCTI